MRCSCCDFLTVASPFKVRKMSRFGELTVRRYSGACVCFLFILKKSKCFSYHISNLLSKQFSKTQGNKKPSKQQPTCCRRCHSAVVRTFNPLKRQNYLSSIINLPAIVSLKYPQLPSCHCASAAVVNQSYPLFSGVDVGYSEPICLSIINSTIKSIS